MEIKIGLEQGQLVDDARRVRELVFIKEQNVPKEIEQDERDAISWHAVVYDHETPIATGRLFEIGVKACAVGRLAVRSDYRGLGLGKLIMERLIELAWERHYTQIEIHAQVHALDFYKRLGFHEYGDRFNEAGIEHVSMRLSIHG